MLFIFEDHILTAMVASRFLLLAAKGIQSEKGKADFDAMMAGGPGLFCECGIH